MPFPYKQEVVVAGHTLQRLPRREDWTCDQCAASTADLQPRGRYGVGSHQNFDQQMQFEDLREVT